MTPVDAYLNRMSWAMGGSFAEQQAARDEIRAHIREQARDLQVEGATERDALARALIELGDPEQLGRELRRSRGTKPLRRPLMQPEGALILDRTSRRHLPQAQIALAAAALSGLALLIVMLFLWP